jgi:trimeric autotransporter adhesin
MAPASRATPSLANTPIARLVTDGRVFATAAAGGRTYVGGDFSLIGHTTGSWVAVAPSGEALADRALVDGSVTTAASDGRGGWFLAGKFRAVGPSSTRARLVHLAADGALDQRWHVNVNGSVDALALHGATLFVAGRFTRVGGQSRASLAAVSVVRGRVLPWRLRGAPQELEKGRKPALAEIDTVAAAVDGRALYVGGGFDRIGGVRRSWAAAVDTRTARILRWNPALNGFASTIEPAPRGRVLFLGGSFTHVGGKRRIAVAAVDAKTGATLRFDAHLSGGTLGDAGVDDLLATRDSLFIAGDFNSVRRTPRNLLAAVNPQTGAVTDWDPHVTGDLVDPLALDLSSDTLYFGGDLSTVGGQRRDGLAAVDARTGVVRPWDPRTFGEIDALAQGAGDVVFVGGEIGSVGATRRAGLAAIDADGEVSAWAPSATGEVDALAPNPDDSRVYVGGAFTTKGAPKQKNFAFIDVASGTLRAFGGGVNSNVRAIAPSPDGSTVYIGGKFGSVAGQRRPHLAALNARTGELTSWNPGADNLVRALVAAPDALYVGGDFSSAGGLPRAGLAKLDLHSGANFAWDPEPDNHDVFALERRDQTLYVGGTFDAIGGMPRRKLAALDTDSGAATSWAPNPDHLVRVLKLSSDGHLYAGGGFEKIGRAQQGCAEFTPDGSLSSWTPPNPFDVYTITLAPDGAIVFGGEDIDALEGGDGGVNLFR